MAQSAADRRRAQRALARQQREIRAGRAKPTSPSYFRRAVERGAERGQMAGGYRFKSGTVSTGYTRSINAIVATGAGVEVVEIYNVPLSQRRLIMEHWNLTQDYLKAKNSKDAARAKRALERFTRKHPNTGGANSQEFSSDTGDIVRSYQADYEAFEDNNRYPKESA